MTFTAKNILLGLMVAVVLFSILWSGIAFHFNLGEFRQSTPTKGDNA